jgi:hypothetical protein
MIAREELRQAALAVSTWLEANDPDGERYNDPDHLCGQHCPADGHEVHPVRGVHELLSFLASNQAQSGTLAKWLNEWIFLNDPPLAEET